MKKIYDGSIPSTRGGSTLTIPQGAATTRVRGRDVMVICRTSGAAVENLLFLWLQARRRSYRTFERFHLLHHLLHVVSPHRRHSSSR